MIGKVKRYRKRKYEVRTELVGGVFMKKAFTFAGVFIGSDALAYDLVVDRGIKVEPGPGGVCSIGFCEKDGRWYGWKDWDIRGFGFGDIIEEGDVIAQVPKDKESDPWVPIGFKVHHRYQAKMMACAYAYALRRDD